MKVVIIGNGLGGVTTASNLAMLDDSIDIEIISEEKYPYYSRVRLIDYIVGNVSEDELIVYDQNWYDAKGITLHLNTRIRSV
nr:nitrite reductase large subunit [Candidatus Sigynarchaeota archaeon]